MASAKLDPQLIPAPPLEDVHLYLTVVEASVLLKALDYINGHEGGPNDALTDISFELCAVGIQRAKFKCTICTNSQRPAHGLWIVEE